MHNGPLLPAEGATGIGFTVAEVSPAGLEQPFSVATTEYVPEAAVVAPTITGSCVPEVKLLGPVHAYVAPPTVLAVKLRSFPEQNGLLLVAVGAAGVRLTVTEIIPSGLVGQPGTLAVTE